MAARITGGEARQGMNNTPVLMVLIGGLVLALAAFAGMGVHGSTLPDGNIPRATAGRDASRTTAPAAAGPTSMPLTVPGTDVTAN